MNAQEHLLACLNEECCEVGQIVDKALRFGLNDRNVLNPTGPTNRERLIEELNDMVGVIQKLEEAKILPRNWQSIARVKAKKMKVEKFMNYARKARCNEQRIYPPPVKCVVKIVRHRRALRVHQATAVGRPVCGGGKGGKSILAWQQDVGPCNCARCRQLINNKVTKEQNAHSTV